MKPKFIIVINGIIASLLLTFVYFGIVSYLQSFNHAVLEFLSISYLMIPLIAGFGVQVALYSYCRQHLRSLRQGSVSVAASGGLSTGSMIACCAHHLIDVAPVLGITAVTSILAAYQSLFIAIGLLSNIVGILTILTMMQKHRLYDVNGAFAKIMHPKIGKIRNYALAISLIMIVIFLLFSFTQQGGPPPSNITVTETTILSSNTTTVESISPTKITTTETSRSTAEKVITLPKKTLSQGGLTIEVTPYPLFQDREVKFRIVLDTHSGDLNFDLTKVSFLEDDQGNTFTPTVWSGSPPGGHHREGELSFPSLIDTPNSIRLIITDIYGFDWFFEWSIT